MIDKAPLFGLRTYPSLAAELSKEFHEDRPRIGFVMKRTSRGKVIGSAHVRILRWLHQPTVRRALSVLVLDPEEVAWSANAPKLDLLVVGRAGIPLNALRVVLGRRGELYKRLVLDVDDDLFDLLPAVRAIAPHCDAIIASTVTLAERSRVFNKNAVVFENAIDYDLWRRDPEPSSSKTPVIGYFGTTTHHQDFQAITPVLERLSRERGVRTEVVGISDRLLPSFVRRLEPPEPDYPSFARWMQSVAGRWTVGIAPLVDSPINRCKSGIKWMEYTALGLPAVVSRFSAYTDVVDAGVTAEVAEDLEDWRRALLRLLDSSEVRLSITESANACVLSKFSVKARAGDFSDLLRGLLR